MKILLVEDENRMAQDLCEILPFESIAYEKNLNLDLNITDNLFVEGNNNKLKQLVSILIDNALAIQ